MRLRYEDSTTFLLSDDRSRIDAWWPKTSALADTECYLSPVFGIMLRLRGVTCMHASAAVVDDRAIAFIGSAGVGKSTTAAALARAGIAVLTDDLLALRDLGHGFLVEPGIPRVQLWPESVEALWGDRDALPRIVPTWEKRYLDLAHPENRFCDVPRPLAAVYVLSGRDEGAERPTIETLRGSQAVVALAANTYGNYLLTPKMRAEELSVLGRLAAQVPVREVVVPNDRARIAEACDAMLDDFRRLTS